MKILTIPSVMALVVMVGMTQHCENNATTLFERGMQHPVDSMEKYGVTLLTKNESILLEMLYDELDECMYAAIDSPADTVDFSHLATYLAFKNVVRAMSKEYKDILYRYVLPRYRIFSTTKELQQVLWLYDTDTIYFCPFMTVYDSPLKIICHDDFVWSLDKLHRIHYSEDSFLALVGLDPSLPMLVLNYQGLSDVGLVPSTTDPQVEKLFDRECEVWNRLAEEGPRLRDEVLRDALLKDVFCDPASFQSSQELVSLLLCDTLPIIDDERFVVSRAEHDQDIKSMTIQYQRKQLVLLYMNLPTEYSPTNNLLFRLGLILEGTMMNIFRMDSSPSSEHFSFWPLDTDILGEETSASSLAHIYGFDSIKENLLDIWKEKMKEGYEKPAVYCRFLFPGLILFYTYSLLGRYKNKT